MADVACIVAAACDLAIADTGFAAAVSASGATMLQCLFEMYLKAHSEFSRLSPEREGLLSLMIYQIMRVTAACAELVRNLLSTAIVHVVAKGVHARSHPLARCAMSILVRGNP